MFEGVYEGPECDVRTCQSCGGPVWDDGESVCPLGCEF